MLAKRLLLLEFFRISSLHGSGVLDTGWKSFDEAPARLILSWSFAVGSSILILAVKQHTLLGFWRITFQSSTEAQGKIAYCPSDRPDNMIQPLTGVDQHHVRCRCAIGRDPTTLVEQCLTHFLKHPNSSMRDEGTGLSS